INQGESVMISDTAQDVANYYWSPSMGLSCDTCWQTSANPLYTTTYTLTKITPCDTTQAAVTVVVIPDTNATLPLPNVFTPNGDGKNDNFSFTMPKDYLVKSFEVYNRWGNLIYIQTKSPSIVNWNGYTQNNQ